MTEINQMIDEMNMHKEFKDKLKKCIDAFLKDSDQTEILFAGTGTHNENCCCPSKKTPYVSAIISSPEGFWWIRTKDVEEFSARRERWTSVENVTQIRKINQDGPSIKIHIETDTAVYNLTPRTEEESNILYDKINEYFKAAKETQPVE